MHALACGRPVLVADLRGVRDHRWPMFAHAAAGTAARAMFCFPLLLGGAGVGVLELYRDLSAIMKFPRLEGLAIT